MGIINNIKNGAKNKGKSKVKKVLTKGASKAMMFVAPMMFKVFIIIIVFLLVTTIIDYAVELLTAENTPDKINESLGVENTITELIEIKGDETNGYYLDFVDDIDSKIESMIKEINKSAEYHNLPEDVEFVKKMLKAEAYTQFPDLRGDIPEEDKDAFQGAVKIRRVIPNKEIGEMKNTGKGETSTSEKETVYDTVQIEEKDESILQSWTEGQKLEVVAKTPLYEQIRETGYWQTKVKEDGNVIYVEYGEIVTYKGSYEASENAITGDVTIYVEVETEGGETAYVKYSTLKEWNGNDSTDGVQNLSEEQVEEKIVTSRAKNTNNKIGKEDEEYVVAIAAGHNNTNDTGASSGNLVEEELTIKVAERVEELLDNYSNITVVQTGSTSENPGGVQVGERTRLAREANPDLCIQIHFNAGGGTGVEAIYKDGDGYSQQLAEILSDTISKSMGLTNRQART